MVAAALRARGRNPLRAQRGRIHWMRPAFVRRPTLALAAAGPGAARAAAAARRATRRAARPWTGAVLMMRPPVRPRRVRCSSPARSLLRVSTSRRRWCLSLWSVFTSARRASRWAVTLLSCSAGSMGDACALQRSVKCRVRLFYGYTAPICVPLATQRCGDTAGALMRLDDQCCACLAAVCAQNDNGAVKTELASCKTLGESTPTVSRLYSAACCLNRHHRYITGTLCHQCCPEFKRNAVLGGVDDDFCSTSHQAQI